MSLLAYRSRLIVLFCSSYVRSYIIKMGLEVRFDLSYVMTMEESYESFMISPYIYIYIHIYIHIYIYIYMYKCIARVSAFDLDSQMPRALETASHPVSERCLPSEKTKGRRRGGTISTHPYMRVYPYGYIYIYVCIYVYTHTLHYTTLHYIRFHYITLRYTTLHNIPYHTTPLPCHAMPRHAMPYIHVSKIHYHDLYIQLYVYWPRLLCSPEY